MALKLIVDQPAMEYELSYLVEEKNKNEPSTLYIQGPYLVAETVNKNNRKYSRQEMIDEVTRFNKEMVQCSRSIGELNHPQSVDINPRDACHLITSIKEEGNIFVGKSKVLTTPMGNIVRSLILDGVKLGISSRALGKLIPSGSHQEVQGFRLITCDVVTDPSAPGCYLNGILEAKEFIVNSDGTISEAVSNAYSMLEETLATLPKHQVDDYLRKAFTSFIDSLKNLNRS